MYEIPVNDTQLDAMERQLHALWAAIERALDRGQFPARPGPLCNWCSYKELCPAWAEADEPAALRPQSAATV